MENIKLKNIRNHLLVGTLSMVLLSSCMPTVIERDRNNCAAVSQNMNARKMVSDLTIKSNIKNQLAKHNMFTLVGVKVVEGRALLTGKVPTQIDRLEAIKLAWQQLGVREVNSEIIVTGDISKSAAQIAKDSWITSEIKSRLLATKNVESLNYGFETIDNVVYILGIAQTSRELDKVIGVAGRVRGVTKVVSYVRIRC